MDPGVITDTKKCIHLLRIAFDSAIMQVVGEGCQCSNNFFSMDAISIKEFSNYSILVVRHHMDTVVITVTKKCIHSLRIAFVSIMQVVGEV